MTHIAIHRNVSNLLLTCGLLAAPLLSPLHAADPMHQWPQWRGPTANGLAPKAQPPLEWSEEKNIKWKVDLPGQGHGTPVIWEDQVFILTAIPTGKTSEPGTQASTSVSQVFAQRDENSDRRRRRRGFGRRGRGGAPTEEMAFTVLCLDRQTGRELWRQVARTAVPHDRVQSSNSYCSESAVTDGERVYASFGSEGLYCYDTEGKLLWKKDLGQASVTFGEASSPALVGDRLIVLQDNNRDSFIYAFDRKTGEALWKQSRDEGSGWTTPYALTHEGQMQVVVPGSNAVRSYDPTTGEVLWQCSGLGSNPVPMIVADDTTVYAMSGHRQPMAMAIELGRTGDLTGTEAVRWKTERGTPYVPSPLLYDGLLFFCQRTQGRLSCLDARSGEPHYQQENLEGLSGIYASLVGAQDRIYITGRGGTVLVIEKSRNLRMLARNRLEDGFDASPALVGKELFLRGREHLYCVAGE